MNNLVDLLRLERILPRLTGDKALRDEAVSIVRTMIDAQAEESVSTEWWATYGPEPGREWRPGIPLSPRPRALVDQIVTFGPCPVEQVAVSLGIEPENARRLVSRAGTELLNRGGKATIAIASGNVYTSTRIIISSAARAND